jgi:hypothetical protein
LLRLRDECGCAAGAWSALAALGTAIVVGIMHGAASVVGIFGLAAVCAGGVIAAGMLGKALTIMVYRARWRRLRDRVVRELAAWKVSGDVLVR